MYKNVYFAGDLHHRHKRICEFRTRFTTVEEHDEYVADRILDTCGKKSILWLMGDLFFTTESMKYFLRYCNNIGQINIVLGNHDTDNEDRRGRLAALAFRANKMGALFKYKEFWLSHAPIHPEELRGKMNIHGHVHTKTLADKRYINVSLENIDYKPISLNAIRQQLLVK